MPALEFKYNLYTIRMFYISKYVCAPKQVSNTGLFTGFKIASNSQTKKVTFEAHLVPAHAGKLTAYAGKAEESFDSI